MTETVSITDGVKAAIESAPWIDPVTDRPTIELALSYARTLDEAADLPIGERTKALYLGPHLAGVLKSLGCTPGERAELTAALCARAGSQRDQLRARREERRRSARAAE